MPSISAQRQRPQQRPSAAAVQNEDLLTVLVNHLMPKKLPPFNCFLASANFPAHTRAT
jgi:hypothetical protein